MKRLVDPLAIVARRLRAEAAGAPATVPHEVDLVPPPGATLHRMTVAGSYREPVPVLYDFSTRTAYPVRAGEA